jgi:hypothetical protein
VSFIESFFLWVKIIFYYFCRHAEHVAELFFLQTSGNMMDYGAWRKKPPMPQFITFKKNLRLDPTATDDNDNIRSVSEIYF